MDLRDFLCAVIVCAKPQYTIEVLKKSKVDNLYHTNCINRKLNSENSEPIKMLLSKRIRALWW